MGTLPHLHHIIQTVEDVFPRLLRLDAHFCLVLGRRLQEEKYSGERGGVHWGGGDLEKTEGGKESFGGIQIGNHSP